MPSIGQVFRNITGTHGRPKSEADFAADAIAANPPVQRDRGDTEYRGLFLRFAQVALLSYRTAKPQQLTVSPQERQLIAAELPQIVAGVGAYLQAILGLAEEPHLQVSMQTAIDIRVTR